MHVDIYYDGACPLCNHYVLYSQLKQHHTVALHDLRQAPEAVAAFATQGFNVNEGMLVRYQERLYFGGDAMHLIATLSRRDTWRGRLYATLFANATLTGAAYPFLRAGRNLLLRMLGRPLL